MSDASLDWALVGLGNPGSKYARTRHNVGFWAVDAFKREFGISGSFTQKFNCEFLKVKLGTSKLENSSGAGSLVLIKPQGYMNRSGETVFPLLQFFKISPKRVIAFHDEVDLETGALKVKSGGSSAGHHGIDDLERHLGTKEFFRVRIGIGRGSSPEGVRDVSGWVLSAAKGEEAEILENTTLEAAKLANDLILNGLSSASQKFSRKAFTR